MSVCVCVCVEILMEILLFVITLSGHPHLYPVCLLNLRFAGIDSNGHSFDPSSSSYLNEISYIDNGIREIVELMDLFYNHDGQTAYILTSDHGMTNQGSHGGGDTHEILSPLTVWGAGIRGPLPSDGRDDMDGLSAKWNLSHLKRADVNQVDIAPLMTSLLGAL